MLAVGKTGLDYARDKKEEQICMQKEWLRKFIELAIEMQKPLVIHCREAYDDTINISQGYLWEDTHRFCFLGEIPKNYFN